MPFGATSDNHTEQYWTDFFALFIKPRVENLGYSCFRSKARPSNIVRQIVADLLTADLVLAVLTDFNVNVWYELGVRHSRKRGTVMLIEEGQTVPFDIAHYGVIKYTDALTAAASFEEDLRSYVAELEGVKTPDSPVLDYLGAQALEEYEQRRLDLEDQYRHNLDSLYSLAKQIQQSQTQEQQGEEEAKAVTGTAFERERAIRVLWVDDFPSNNASFVDLFSQRGFDFELVLSTEQAMKSLQSKSYDLVISDMGRGADVQAGLTLIRRINRTLAPAPRMWVFASTAALSKYGAKAREEGAVIVTSDASAVFRALSALEEEFGPGRRFNFLELDAKTRAYMLDEFSDDFAGVAGRQAYYNKRFTPAGRQAYPDAMREAIRSGNERTLSEALAEPGYWQLAEAMRTPNGSTRFARTPQTMVQTFCEGEFNHYYMSALALRLIEEGHPEAEVYRAKVALEPRDADPPVGARLSCEDLLADLRSRDYRSGGRTGILLQGPNAGISIKRVNP